MHDPFARATSRAPATLGEGCTSRYDPDALTAEDGAGFTEAAALWQRLQQSQELPALTPAVPGPGTAD